jgi:hypothetical protein
MTDPIVSEAISFDGGRDKANRLPKNWNKARLLLNLCSRQPLAVANIRAMLEVAAGRAVDALHATAVAKLQES